MKIAPFSALFMKSIIIQFTQEHSLLNLNILLLSTEQLSQLYSSLKQTYKTQHFVRKLSTKNMNKNMSQDEVQFSLAESKVVDHFFDVNFRFIVYVQ